MKLIKLKIRDHFISLIREGIKTNEYRLADPKYSDIRVGDILVLVSNQNPENYVKVVVDSITNYANWDSALKNNWKNDFKGLFDSYNDVMKECHRFYPKQEVDKYGINVYKIRIYKKTLNKARYLFDTNTIIERESSNNVSSEVALVYAAIDKQNGIKFYHEKTVDEISKYGNTTIRDNILTKLNAYQKLYSSNETSVEFERVCSLFSQDENSQNDNEILRQVYNGCVDYLITSDHNILKKASLLYLEDSVFTPNSYLRKVEEENPKLIEYDVLSIDLVPIGTLDINDKFFDTLREDYKGAKFNNWLRRKSNEDAYVFKNKTELQGFLYLKTEYDNEDYSNFVPQFLPAKRLKVGTFKISQSGLRLGERFLKIIFDNAIKRNVDEVYVTLFENKRQEVAYLKSMMEQWGFVKRAYNKENGEVVLVKKMREYDYNKDPKYNYPLLMDNKQYMFLPIVSQYHTKLFPDLYLKNERMKIYDEEACRYAIEKIYVCGWKNVKAKPGDLVCIYRMGDYYKTYTSVVSGIGVLQEIKYPENEDSFINECKNKSVFSENELRSFYKGGTFRTIIKVLFLYGFDNKVNLKDLYENGIIEEQGPGPRVNTFISEQSFNKLKELGKE